MTYARTQGIPFIEDSTANFIYLGTPNSVSVPGDFNGWSTSAWPMTHLSQTNFWYRSENFELDARLDYKFVMNGSNWILDPENPNICQGGFGPNSELSMPLYVQPWEINYQSEYCSRNSCYKNFLQYDCWNKLSIKYLPSSGI